MLRSFWNKVRVLEEGGGRGRVRGCKKEGGGRCRYLWFYTFFNDSKLIFELTEM